MKAGLVYKFNFNDCSSSYIGEYGRLLKEKLNEHKKDIEKCMHACKNTVGHTFDGDQIMGKVNNKYVRNRLEGIHTFKESDTLNRAWEVNPIYSSIYLQNIAINRVY